jgi:thiol-disulfide isomerase/thioredoxin
MKTRLLTLALIGCFSLVGASRAQAPGGKTTDVKAPAKTPADLAYDEFNKERNASGAKDQARFQKVIAAGMTCFAQHPTYWRVNDVVTGLAFYGNAIDKKQVALRTAYVSLLKLEIANQRYKDGVSDATKTALAALDAAVADFEVREAFNKDNLVNFREKIDGLAEAPGGARFLADRERSYVHILTLGTSLARAEDHLKKLLAHPDKGVAGMARTELNLVEIKRQPYELSFTAFDGKPVDFAQLRGKVVVLYFWSSTNKGSIGALDALKQIASDYRKKGLEVVTVSYDKAEDREKLAAAIKENRISWPVHFDGKGAKAEFAAKLNITGVPALLVFDQKGMLLHTMQGTNLTVNLPVNQLDGQVRRMFGIK